jgi:hypothetical protein
MSWHKHIGLFGRMGDKDRKAFIKLKPGISVIKLFSFAVNALAKIS